jgi:bacteriorhodopsin
MRWVLEIGSLGPISVGANNLRLSVFKSIKYVQWLIIWPQLTLTMIKIIMATLVSIVALFTFVAMKVVLLVGLAYAVYAIASRMH